MDINFTEIQIAAGQQVPAGALSYSTYFPLNDPDRNVFLTARAVGGVYAFASGITVAQGLNSSKVETEGWYVPN